MIITDHLYGMECELKTDQLNVLILEKTDTFTGFIEHLEAKDNVLCKKLQGFFTYRRFLPHQL